MSDPASTQKAAITSENEGFYNLSVMLNNGQPLHFSGLKNKVVVIVNTASQCGFTGQYAALEELYRKYASDGLEIIGFPCNQFGNQEQRSDAEIASFCQINYGVTFPITEKSNVNGKNTHPVFKFLKAHLSGFLTSAIKWNFTKFVIDRNGKPVKRYAPWIAPDKMEPLIQRLLNNID